MCDSAATMESQKNNNTSSAWSSPCYSRSLPATYAQGASSYHHEPDGINPIIIQKLPIWTELERKANAKPSQKDMIVIIITYEHMCTVQCSPSLRISSRVVPSLHRSSSSCRRGQGRKSRRERVKTKYSKKLHTPAASPLALSHVLHHLLSGLLRGCASNSAADLPRPPPVPGSHAAAAVAAT